METKDLEKEPVEELKLKIGARYIHNNEKTIIRDVDGRIKTVVFKQGELLETHNDNDNQQPSISSNAFKGSTTNSRVQTDNAEDSNADTSALPSINTSDDIV